jgi:hypothetical protein
LLAHGWWFSPGTAASSTTKTGRHDVAEIFAESGIKHKKSINQSICTVSAEMSISKLKAVQGFKVNLKATREYIGLSSASQKQEKVVIVSVIWESPKFEL